MNRGLRAFSFPNAGSLLGNAATEPTVLHSLPNISASVRQNIAYWVFYLLLGAVAGDLLGDGPAAAQILDYALLNRLYRTPSSYLRCFIGLLASACLPAENNVSFCAGDTCHAGFSLALFSFVYLQTSGLCCLLCCPLRAQTVAFHLVCWNRTT